MALQRFDPSYEKGFHFYKFICLLSIVFSHSVSFVNQQIKASLGESPIFLLFEVFASIGTHFIALAGVSLCLFLRKDIKKERLQNQFVGWGKYLFILLLVDGCKDAILYDDLTSFFRWSFLKTIFVSYFLTIFLTRVHISLNIIISFVLIFFLNPIREKIYELTWSGSLTPIELSAWNVIHTSYFLFLLTIFILIVWTVWKSLLLRRMKFFFYLLSCIALYFAGNFILELKPTLSTYQFFQNWWVEGLIGSKEKVVLYPLLDWAPTFLLGFSLTHYAVRWADFYEKNHKVVFIISVCAFVGFCFLSLNYISVLRENIRVFWRIGTFMQTSLALEFLKFSFIIFIFLLIFEVRSRFSFGKWDRLFQNWSVSSFLIYIVCTTLSQWLGTSFARYFGLLAASLLTILVSLFVCHLVSYLAFIFYSRRLKLTLVKSEK